MNDNLEKIPILYSFRRCPFAIRARTMILLTGIKCELREVSLSNKPIEMLNISKKGTVPVLQLKDKIIDESLEIMLWALNKKKNKTILAPYLKFKNDVDYIISIIDGDFKYNLDRYKYFQRFKFGNRELHRDKAYLILKDLEKKISYSFSSLSHLSFLFISINPLIRQFKNTDSEWFDNLSDIDNIKKYLFLYVDSPLFKQVMKKYKNWNNDSDPNYFP